MRLLKFTAVVAVAACFQMTSLLACEQFKPLDQEAAQKLMDTLAKPDSPGLTRIFAFKTLACAQEPIVRRFALEEGLKSADKLMRGQALAEVLMQRESIRIELIESGNLSPQSKDWIKNVGGSLLYSFRFRDRIKNCIGISYDDRCHQTDQVVIDGSRIRVLRGNASGEFDLQQDSTLRGMIKPHEGAPPIPARIPLL